MSKKPKQSPADLPLLGPDIEAYSIAETARLFGLSTQQVRRLVNEGRLEGVGHRATPTGLGYYVPRAAMEARGYVLKAPTSSEEAEALKAEKEALEARIRALTAELEAAQARAKTAADAAGKAEEAASTARANLAGLRTELDKAQALAEAKARESYLLEQALLRLPLALGTGSSWWQRVRRKRPTEAEKRAALEALKGATPPEKPAE
jgi:DNA-binding transcriptional MerR regulator